MNIRTRGRSPRNQGQTSQPGKQLAGSSSRKGKVALPLTPHDLPRASSRTNDNYCMTKLQTRLLAGRTPQAQTRDILTVKSPVVLTATSAPGQSQKKDLSPGPADCHYLKCKLKSVKSVSCVTQLSCVNTVSNVRNAALNLSVGARLQKFWQTWLDLGAGPKVLQILREGYTLPFWNRPKLTRFPTVISCYANLHRNSYLLEALYQLIDKNAVELVHNQMSLGFFNRLFLVPKPNNKWRPILDLSKLNLFLKAEKFKMETPETIKNIPPAGGVGYLNRLQGRLLPYPYTGTVQEISEISCPGSDIPIQSTALWSVHSTLGVHCSGKGVETDGNTQGYKDPRVPRRLVGESQILPGLSSAYTNSDKNMPKIRLASEFGQVGTGTQTNLRFCRLPVRPQDWSGPTDSRPVAESSGQDIGNLATTGLSGPTVHVPDRLTDSHREASSPRPVTHEGHTVASQKALENTRITRKGDPNSQFPAPSFTMVATGRQRPYRPTITPSKTCSANLYRRIKRRVGRPL